MCKLAYKSYFVRNSNSWQLLASPILFTENKYLGAWLYKVPNNKCQPKSLMHWYESDIYKSKAITIQRIAQTVSVDYPIMCYKGFTPDNRELIYVNLADAKQPQRIINLLNM